MTSKHEHVIKSAKLPFISYRNHPYLSLREFAEKSRKLAQEIAAENNEKCGEKCGTCQEFAELFAENCGFGPNHEICCICRIAIWAVDLLQEVVKYQGVVKYGI